MRKYEFTIDPIGLIREKIVDAEDINPKEWTRRDAEILEIAARTIRRHALQPTAQADRKKAPAA